jgi:myosin protein heavy chain
VDDLAEWRVLKASCSDPYIGRELTLQDALRVVGFSEQEQLQLFRIPAVILHIGNITLTGNGSDQALIPSEAQPAVDKVCHLLGIDVTEFSKTVLRPKVRAGREWVTQARTKKQAEDELAALCKYMYEKNFGWMVDRINTALDRPSPKS